MNKCKKILAVILTLAMAMSLCAFTVSADEEATTPASVLYSKHTFDKSNVGTKWTKNATGPALDQGFGGGAFMLKSAGANGGSSVIKADETGNQYISCTYGAIGYNHRQVDTALAANIDLNAYPVLHFSYDTMIPDTDPNKTAKRFSTLNVGTTKSGSYSNTVMDLRVEITDGVITAKNHSGGSKIYTGETSYTYGQWVTVEGYIWIESDNKFKYVVYANDTMILAGKNNTATLAHTTGTWEFRHDDPKTLVTETCYDNALIDFVPASVIDSENAKITAEIANKPYVELLKYPGSAIGSNAGSKAAAVFVNKGVVDGDMVQGGDTDEHTAEAYEVIDSTYTNITSSSYKYLVGNVRESFSKYVPKGLGDKSTYVYSADMMVSDFNAQVLGRISLGLDMMSGDVKDEAGNVILKENKSGNSLVSFTIGTDGKIEIDNTMSEKHSYVPCARVPGAERSERRDVTPNEWFNVKFVYEVTHGETAYEIKVYGIFEDEVIYVDEFTITYTDYDKDGVSDDIHIGNCDLLIGTDNNTHEETVTSFKSLTFVKDSNFDWSTINTDAWRERPVELSKDADGNIDAYVKLPGLETGVLVVVTYDANGKLVKLFSSADCVENAFACEVPAAELEGVEVVKAFLFDSITNSVPLAKHDVLGIE